ncbi:mitochondrion protein [Phaffia rhodozyma]|uniref:Mitochondrial carrier protein n=1 Tax=Phaffia rhodozyma TaxID=264483 RepID=A0A0F7SMA2_PHARH|nr:mitochondrial carrier protein [Phaffia rhodozyma]CDZ98604.1 mitochondrion protein [Phaffia rhodozyma]
MASTLPANGDLVDLSADRYDLTTYIGRLKHFYTVTSPLTLLAPVSKLEQSSAAVKKAQERIDEAKGRPVWVGRAERDQFWKDKQLVDSSIHPDTGKAVPLLFRMSAFVPTNLVICAGMLTPNPSLRTLIFWQWANQSLNVAVNYNNANKSISLSTQELLTAYTSATLTSVLIAVSLSRMVPKIPNSVISQSGKELLGKMVPFASVASAGVVNISCIRWKEIRDGITVFRLNRTEPPQGAPDAKPIETKEELGKSSVAGTRAVGQSAASRVLTNIPTLIFPPLIMTALAARGAFQGPRKVLWENLSQLSILGASLYFFLPPSIAVFPQRASVSLGKLEKDKFERFARAENGGLDEKVFFNKGL